ncbi:DUF6279 family lipoprotein [Idiomarina sp. HP20-50]|uniref:DUF6279 family lipoprotein n=1 Tax=Idiomarina sp. HP20-50 TaxID=3070813 RepID=UPI00294AE974|nr:DUF6279 family lipoprotein [Idiomarina sp. HP20-50]MDV6315141.1 DUF6279 family lipoprotein [Idiomarina sp. HP20-50]
MYRLLGVLTVLAIIAGCTANIGYQFADTLVEWKVKDYVDLNDQQEKVLAQKIDAMHQWHAQTQLPLYRSELKALRDKVKTRSLTLRDIEAFENTLWVFWRNVLEQLEAESDLISTLSVKQRQQLIARLEEAQEERYQRWQEDKQDNPILQRLDRVTEVEEDLEDIIGDLTEEQDKLLRRWVNDSPGLQGEWLSYRSRWLTEFEKVLLNQPLDKDRLASLIVNPQQLRSKSFQKQREQSSERRRQFLWEMYQSLTNEQREKVINKADEYINLIDSLISDFSD